MMEWPSKNETVSLGLTNRQGNQSSIIINSSTKWWVRLGYDFSLSS
jgi:hypothetical protein